MICFLNLSLFSQEKTISFYHVKYIEENPFIDGNLNENCWNICKREKNFYKYWQTKPIKGELQTEFMIFYNERGL